MNALSAYCVDNRCTRKNFPIRLGYASTIHKVQGATLTAGVVNLGKNEKHLGSSFVAISRFKRFDQFLIEPFSFDRITSMIKKSKLYKPRLDEETNLERLSEITRKNLCYLLPTN